jgi:acetyl-CoA carboxylase carboxyltransferase component
VSLREGIELNAKQLAALRQEIQRPRQEGVSKLQSQRKLPVRERLSRLFDAGAMVEDGLLANAIASGLPADGVVTGIGRMSGRRVAVIANDPLVKAGSWGARTVEKIIRMQEMAERLRIPLLYLVDSAGARITDQVEMFPGRRHAGRIFYNQVRLSGQVPQVCVLFGPSAAGGAYIPAFCDVVIMVDGNASMYLGSPRMAEVVIGERIGLEELGGARMHCAISGCGDFLATDESAAIEVARQYLAFMPDNSELHPARTEVRPVAPGEPLRDLIPTSEKQGYDMHSVIEALIDEGTWLEVKELYAQELIVGFARIWGLPLGIVANQPSVKGGVLFNDSADKAARFVSLCDAFNLPLLFLVDVPGFMIGSAVERAGIIRHGAKMIAAVSQCTVPRVSAIVRKAYGAGLYAMSGPAFGTDATLALPTAEIAVMGPEPAVNAVYANRLAKLGTAEAVVERQRLQAEYSKNVDLLRLASDLVIDDITRPDDLRNELRDRFALYQTRAEPALRRKHAVLPV